MKNKEVKPDYEIDVEIFEQESLNDWFEHTMNVHIEKDNRGFKGLYILSSNNNYRWTKEYENKPIVTVEDSDLDYDITIHKYGEGQESVKLKLDTSEIGYLRTLFETLHRVAIKNKDNKLGLFGRTKLGTIIKKEELK